MVDVPKDPTALNVARYALFQSSGGKLGGCSNVIFLTELVGTNGSSFDPLFAWTWESDWTGVPGLGGARTLQDSGALAPGYPGGFGAASMIATDVDVNALPLDERLLMVHDGAIGVSTPEPATWALMLLGFAGLGFAGYRRAKSRGVTTPAAV